MEDAHQIRFCFKCDDDGHWYAIPVSSREAFELFLEERNYEAFNNVFAKFRLETHYSSYSFTDLQEIK